MEEFKALFPLLFSPSEELGKSGMSWGRRDSREVHPGFLNIRDSWKTSLPMARGWNGMSFKVLPTQTGPEFHKSIIDGKTLSWETPTIRNSDPRKDFPGNVCSMGESMALSGTGLFQGVKKIYPTLFLGI